MGVLAVGAVEPEAGAQGRGMEKAAGADDDAAGADDETDAGADAGVGASSASDSMDGQWLLEGADRLLTSNVLGVSLRIRLAVELNGWLPSKLLACAARATRPSRSSRRMGLIVLSDGGADVLADDDWVIGVMGWQVLVLGMGASQRSHRVMPARLAKLHEGQSASVEHSSMEGSASEEQIRRGGRGGGAPPPRERRGLTPSRVARLATLRR